MNSRKVLMKKKKILKFQENANACSKSKMKYDHTDGLNKELMSFTGNPQTIGAFLSPLALFSSGKPRSICPIRAGVATIHSSILINLGLPAITDSDFSNPKNISQFAIFEV